MWPIARAPSPPECMPVFQRAARRASELADLLPAVDTEASHVVLGAAADGDTPGPWLSVLARAPLLRAVPRGHLLTLGCGETRKLDLAMTALATWRGPLLFARGGDLRPVDAAALRWRREVLGRDVFVIGPGHGSVDALGWLSLVPVSGRADAARLAAETLVMEQPYDALPDGALPDGALEAARNAAADALVSLWRIHGRRPRLSEWLAELDGSNPLLARARDIPADAVAALNAGPDPDGPEQAVIEAVAAGRADALLLWSYAASWSAPVCLRLATLALTAPYLAAGSRGLLLLLHRLEWMLPWSWTDEILMNVRSVTMWGVSENLRLDRLGPWPDRVWAMQYAGARGVSPCTERLLRVVEGGVDDPDRHRQARIAGMPRRLQILTLKGHEGGFLGVKAPWWGVAGIAGALAPGASGSPPPGGGPPRADLRDSAPWQWPSRTHGLVSGLATWQRRAQGLLPRFGAARPGTMAAPK